MLLLILALHLHLVLDHLPLVHRLSLFKHLAHYFLVYFALGFLACGLQALDLLVLLSDAFRDSQLNFPIKLSCLNRLLHPQRCLLSFPPHLKRWLSSNWINPVGWVFIKLEAHFALQKLISFLLELLKVFDLLLSVFSLFFILVDWLLLAFVHQFVLWLELLNVTIKSFNRLLFELFREVACWNSTCVLGLYWQKSPVPFSSHCSFILS